MSIKMNKIIILCCIVLVKSNAFNFSVEVVFESYDPESIKFFVEQFYPNYHIFENYVKIVPCPFGQSKVWKWN